MKQKKRFFKPYGLRSRFIISIILSICLCGLVFVLLYYSSHTLLLEHFEKSSFERTQILRLGKDLQKFIDNNNISSETTYLLNKWEKKTPVVLLELYVNDNCIYSSYYDSPDDAHSYTTEIEDRNNVVIIQLADTLATAIIYTDYIYKYHMICTIISIMTSLVLLVLIFLFINRKLIHYICRLNQEVQIIEGGNLDFEVSVEGNDEITDLAKSMNRMRLSFRQQIETEQKLYQANRQLITEMSHDIRTPLTGMLLYLEILRGHRYTTEAQLQDYLKKIEDKAHHMKTLTDRLFEYSLKDVPPHIFEENMSDPSCMMNGVRITNQQGKAHHPEEGINLESISLSITCLIEELRTQGFTVATELNWTPCTIKAHPEYVTRIQDNIFSNLMKYADPDSEILVQTISEQEYCGFSVSNICKASSETIESTGIGIENIRNMMREMEGFCTVELDGTFFVITLLFLKL